MKNPKMPNSLHWNMTSSTDDRMVYLSAMRHLREYCKKGYCDFMFAAYRFSDFPQTLAMRVLKPYRHVKPFVFDWGDKESVRIFLIKFFTLLTQAYHTRFNEYAFNEAFEEFASQMSHVSNVSR